MVQLESFGEVALLMPPLVVPSFGKSMKSISKLLLVGIGLLILLAWNLIINNKDERNLGDLTTLKLQESLSELSHIEPSKAFHVELKDTQISNSNNQVRPSMYSSSNQDVPAKSMEELIKSFKKEQSELASKAGENPFEPITK